MGKTGTQFYWFNVQSTHTCTNDFYGAMTGHMLYILTGEWVLHTTFADQHNAFAVFNCFAFVLKVFASISLTTWCNLVNGKNVYTFSNFEVNLLDRIKMTKY